MAEDPAIMSLPRFLCAALLVASASATAAAQPPQPGRHLPYHSVDQDPREPLADERGLPRTPRLSLGPATSYASLSFAAERSDLVGVGGQVDLHVPLGAYALVGVRARFERRSVWASGYDQTVFSDELDFGSAFNLGLVGQLRLIRHSVELGVGAAFGPTRFAYENATEWGYFVDPHLSLRVGRAVAFSVSAGAIYRRWPASSITEIGAQVSLGLSFLLWSQR